MNDRTRADLLLIIRWGAIAGLNIVGGYAILLIAYGTAVSINRDYFRMRFLDEAAPVISTIFTLLATLVTAVSIYFPPHLRIADTASRKFSSPLIIIGVIMAFCYMALNKSILPDNVLNGFALLGFVGALFRLLPFSEERGLSL
jgi:hypothetical protein